MMEVQKPPDSIELRHLRYFVAAAEHGSFRKAGTALGLSQSAISRCIADLEDQIGASLFHRHTCGVSQTDAGQRFLRRARQALRTVGEGAQDIASVGRSEEGRIRIGIYSSIASGFLAELLGRYGQHHNPAKVRVVSSNLIARSSLVNVYKSIEGAPRGAFCLQSPSHKNCKHSASSASRAIG